MPVGIKRVIRPPPVSTLPKPSPVPITVEDYFPKTPILPPVPKYGNKWVNQLILHHMSGKPGFPFVELALIQFLRSGYMNLYIHGCGTSYMNDIMESKHIFDIIVIMEEFSKIVIELDIEPGTINTIISHTTSTGNFKQFNDMKELLRHIKSS